jgi:uncharacterized protein Yka (UPF0111/DUF47 family)
VAVGAASGCPFEDTTQPRKTEQAFVDFMQDGSEANALRIREMEHEGDALKAEHMSVLNQAFATPMDREDIYRAITTIDHVINYAKTSVREMELLRIQPDNFMLELAQALQQGMASLRTGYGKLSTNPASAEEDAQAVRKAERNTEKVYRRALSELFDEEVHINKILEGAEPEHHMKEVLSLVMSTFKRREIYRHLSNAGDRLARAGEVLHDIVVKIS